MTATRAGREVLSIMDATDGLLAMREAVWLYRSAAGARTIVEIGSFRGRSCVLLGRGALASGAGAALRITAIDPHMPSGDAPRMKFNAEDHQTFLRTVERFGVLPHVNKLISDSRRALENWDGTLIDLLWVDGDHTYEGALFDIAQWGKLVAPGGLMLAHDYGRYEGVTRAWDETVRPTGSGWGPTRIVRTIATARKLGS